jgi:hypothetical protein
MTSETLSLAKPKVAISYLCDAFVAANEESATKIAETVTAGQLEVVSKRVLNRDSLMEFLDQQSRAESWKNVSKWSSLPALETLSALLQKGERSF